MNIDSDLQSCLIYNPQVFVVEDIADVLAVVEGEREVADWHWILKLNKSGVKKRGYHFVYLTGGCDYTGWDCQSSASSEFASTARKAVKFFVLDKAVQDSLLKQLKDGKNKTWRETKNEEFGIK